MTPSAPISGTTKIGLQKKRGPVLKIFEDHVNKHLTLSCNEGHRENGDRLGIQEV